MPAPGQGALGVQCRADDLETLRLLDAIEHASTRLSVTAERVFLAALGGGCSLPVGAMAVVTGSKITLSGVVAAPDGSRILRLKAEGMDPLQLGQELAKKALDAGAADYLPDQGSGAN